MQITLVTHRADEWWRGRRQRWPDQPAGLVPLRLLETGRHSVPVPGKSARTHCCPINAGCDAVNRNRSLRFRLLSLVRDMNLAVDVFPASPAGDDSGDPVLGTYTVVGNQLTISEPVHDSDGEIQTTSYTMTPDGQVFVGGRFRLYVGEDFWATAIMVGVQAASCD